MDSQNTDRFGTIIRGFIRSNLDIINSDFVPDPVLWLATKMGKSNRTIENYLSTPSMMSLDNRALMKQVLRENLVENTAIDMICDLIDKTGCDNAEQ